MLRRGRCVFLRVVGSTVHLMKIIEKTKIIRIIYLSLPGFRKYLFIQDIKNIIITYYLKMR